MKFSPEEVTTPRAIVVRGKRAAIDTFFLDCRNYETSQDQEKIT